MFERVRRYLWRARDAARDYLNPRHREAVFSRIYAENLWGCAESRSGIGSTPAATSAIVAQLPGLWKRYGIRSLVDAPCGDCNWMSAIAPALDQYVGVDIVGAVIEENRTRYPHLAFLHADLTRDVLPRADAVLCRDCFQHLPTRLILAAIERFRSSGARFMFLTHDPNVRSNDDAVVGGFRPLNLQLPPFNFPAPTESIAEDGSGRLLSMWRIAD